MKVSIVGVVADVVFVIIVLEPSGPRTTLIFSSSIKCKTKNDSGLVVINIVIVVVVVVVV